MLYKQYFDLWVRNAKTITRNTEPQKALIEPTLLVLTMERKRGKILDIRGLRHICECNAKDNMTLTGCGENNKITQCDLHLE